MPVTRPGFLRSVRFDRSEVTEADAYPFSISALRGFEELELDPRVTLIAGENGSGKSTFLEALAVAIGLNAEGGGSNFRFETRSTESPLHKHLRLIWNRLPGTDFFLRAESFYNVASQIEDLDDGTMLRNYGGLSPHAQSHGESFLNLAVHRFGPDGLYLLDEPESALSPTGQLALMVRMHDLAAEGAQFIVATHSPILLAFPRALILAFDETGIHPVGYDELPGVAIYRAALSDPAGYMDLLLRPDDG